MSGKLLDGKTLKRTRKLKSNNLFPEKVDSWNSERPALITGGSGFIGTNLAHRILLSGQ